MSETLVGLGAFVVLLGLIALGVPIAFASALAGIGGLFVIGGPDIAMYYLGSSPYSEISTYAYTALPLYILLGEFAYFGGHAKGAYRTGREWFGSFPGGLAIATIVGGAGFGAVCGASVASSAVLGKICIPEMRKLGYDKSLASGTVAACANLSSMIPPSGLMIVYSIFTGQSLGKLFMAGVLPGLLLVLLFAAITSIRVWKDPKLAPRAQSVSWKTRLSSLRHAWGVFLIGGIVLGGIYSGIVTVTEAAGVGALVAFLLALASRSLTWGSLKGILLSAVQTTVMVLFIIVGIMIFTNFLTLSRLPLVLSQSIAALPVNRHLIIGCILILYLVLGMFFDAISMMALTIPLLFPVVTSLGYDPIWFGVVCVLMCEIGLITPPVGVNCYVVASVAEDIRVEDVFRGVTPFVAMNLVVATSLVIFPKIALFLPGLM